MVASEEGASGTGPGLPDGLAYLLLFSEALLDLVPDGVVVLDDRLRIRSANPAMLRVLGLESRDAARGRELSEIPFFQRALPERPGQNVASVLRGLLVSGERRVGPLRLADGRRSWTVFAAPWDSKDPSQRRVLVTVSPGTSSVQAPDALLEEKDDRIFSLSARTHTLLDHLPLGVCVLDPALGVRSANRWVQRRFGRSFRADRPGDRHLFAVFPELRDPELHAALQKCRDSAESFQGAFLIPSAAGARVTIEVEIQPVCGAGRNVSELLLLIHEVLGMTTPADSTSEVFVPIPCDPAEILSPANLERWPASPSQKFLVVESDPWLRMVVSDALREAGHDDVTLVETGADAAGHFDLGSFGFVVVGLEGNRDDALAVCRTYAEEHPRVPVLAITDRAAGEAREIVGEINLFGILTGPFQSERLTEIVDGLTRSSRERAVPSETSAADAPLIDAVLIGAQESDVGVLRLLYRVQHMNIRMVYDPDPSAFGLSLAQNLGIPTMSGEPSMQLEPVPKVVILARNDLASHLPALDLQDVPMVTRDELELFLVDPSSFLDVGPRPPEHGSPGPVETPPGDLFETIDPAASAPDAPSAPVEAAPPPPPEPHVPEPQLAAPLGPAPPEAQPPAPPEPAPRDEPAAPPPPAEDSTEEPLPGGVMHQEVVSLWESAAPEERCFTDREPPANEDVGSLLHALDLLLDFDRLCTHVLETAIEISSGASGSLMLLQEDKRELRIVASNGLSDLVVQQTRQRVGEGIAGRVAADGEPLLLLGTIGDERFKRAKERSDIRSSLCVPIAAEGRIVGVINVNSNPAGTPFGRETLRNVARLGHQVGIAIDRSLQLRRMRGRSFELSVRAEIESIAASGEDIISRLRRISARVVQMLNVDTCAIFMVDPKRQELVLRAASGFSMARMDAISIPVGNGAIGWVARHLSPLVLRATEEDKEPEGLQPASVAMPIRYHTDLIGVMVIDSTRNVAIDEERLALIGSVASVVGQQIGESRAHEDSERRVTMLSALSELGVAFTAAQDRVSLSKLVTFSASTVLESEVATIRLLRENVLPGITEPEYFELLAAHGATVSGPDDPLTDLEERIAREILATSAPCRDLDLELTEVEPLMQRSNVSAVLGVPMTLGDQLIGTITVYRVKDAKGRHFAFREEEIEIATRLGDYATGAAHRFVAQTDEEEFPKSGDLQ